MEKKGMQDRKVTPEMVPVIKLAREKKYNYARIASYFEINQGRIAIPPANELPADFPSA